MANTQNIAGRIAGLAMAQGIVEATCCADPEGEQCLADIYEEIEQLIAIYSEQKAKADG